MIHRLVVIHLFIIIYINFIVNCYDINHNIEKSTNKTLRHRRRHHKSNISPHLLLSYDQNKANYGSELPSFAYDYSEVFISAMIERLIENDDIYLVMFLFGHKVLSDDFAFDYISTDEHILYSWAQITNNMISKDYSDIHISNMQCVIYNNDPDHKTTYYSQAYWMNLQYENNNITESINVLRCRMKGKTSAYTTLSHSDSSIFVDIIRKQRSNHTTASNSSNTRQDPKSLLISFSIPWRTRYAGYGFKLQSNFTSLDPWHPPVKNEINSAICLGLSRPLHPIRSDVEIPMLIESIEHHLSIGFKHIFIGLILESHSSVFIRHRLILDTYIVQGLVSLLSISMDDKYDDIGGFLGVTINPTLLQWIFHNQCNYYNKGIYDYIAILKPNEFLFPHTFGQVISDTIDKSNIVSSYRFPVYEVSDPVNAPHDWGPGKNHWTIDYFNISNSYIYNTSVESAALLSSHQLRPSSHHRIQRHIKSDHTLHDNNKAFILSFIGVVNSYNKPIQLEDIEKITIQYFIRLYPSISTRYDYIGIALSPSNISTIYQNKLLSSKFIKDKPLTKSNLKRPYWEPCNVHNLRDVIRRVFHFDH